MEKDIIVNARITEFPKSLFDPMPIVMITLKSNPLDEIKLFEFYPDEITFYTDEFIGLTIDEARHLKYNKDLNYLRS